MSVVVRFPFPGRTQSIPKWVSCIFYLPFPRLTRKQLWLGTDRTTKKTSCARNYINTHATTTTDQRLSQLFINLCQLLLSLAADHSSLYSTPYILLRYCYSRCCPSQSTTPFLSAHTFVYSWDLHCKCDSSVRVVPRDDTQYNTKLYHSLHYIFKSCLIKYIRILSLVHLLHN